VVTAEELKTAHSLYSFPQSILGNDGFALAYINRFQYPLATSNGGKTWTIAGAYFSGPWADASAGGTIIKTLDSPIAIVYGNEWFYGTTDGGRRWFVTSFSGTAVSANESWGKRWSHAPVFTVDVIAQAPNLATYPVIAVAQYISSDGGKNWHLATYPSKWAASASGSLMLQGSYSNPAKIGTLITKSDLKSNPLASQSFTGRYGYALGGVDGFQYAVRTTDGGKTWRVAGIWFGGPWADAAAFAYTIKTYDPLVAVAKNSNWFYTTVDAGRHWYRSAVFGGPLSCSQLRPRRGGIAPVLSCMFSSGSSPKTIARYLSFDGGLRWLLL
jgi:hypothetical protein